MKTFFKVICLLPAMLFRLLAVGAVLAVDGVCRRLFGVQSLFAMYADATGSDLHIDVMLSELALGYRPTGFIADQIMPVVGVSKQSNLYRIFSRADRTRSENDLRAPGTRARQVTESVGSGTYFAHNYALGASITVEDRANADPLDLAEVLNGKSTLVMDKLLVNYELRVAKLVTSGSNVGSFSSPTSAWNAAGNPLGNLNQALDNVNDSNGVRANRVVMGLDAWRSFRRDSNVRNLIFGANNGGGYPSIAQAANLLDIETLLIGGAFYNAGEEDLAESITKIWGDHVLCYYTPGAPSRETPSFAYSFRWRTAALPDFQVERLPYDPYTKSEALEIAYYQDEKITGKSYGFAILNVNSSH